MALPEHSARCATEVAAAVADGKFVALVEVRGTGASCPESEHGQQAAITSHSATSLMLGQPLLAGQPSRFPRWRGGIWRRTNKWTA